MPLRSPTSTLLCSPPTPSLPSVAAPVSPRQRPTSVRRTCSSPLHRCPRQPVQRRRHFYPGSPSAGSLPRRNEGLPGAWAILFVRAVVQDPAGCNRPSPVLGAVTVVFRCGNTLDTRKSDSFRGCSTHGPHARVPTHRRIRYRLRRKARYRPGRAHPWPGGFRTRWMTKQGFMKSSQTPFLLDQPCLVALPPEPMLPEMPSPCACAMTALWRCGEIAGAGETGAASD